MRTSNYTIGVFFPTEFVVEDYKILLGDHSKCVTISRLIQCIEILMTECFSHK